MVLSSHTNTYTVTMHRHSTGVGPALTQAQEKYRGNIPEGQWPKI